MPPASSPAAGRDACPAALRHDPVGFGCSSIPIGPGVQPANLSGDIVLVLNPVVQVFAYANPATAILEQAAQAAELITALHTFQSNFIELDFSGVKGVSRQFSDRFAGLAGAELVGVWLTPRHYHASCERLVKPLLARLQRQRERAWAEGCDKFMAGSKEP